MISKTTDTAAAQPITAQPHLSAPTTKTNDPTRLGASDPGSSTEWMTDLLAQAAKAGFRTTPVFKSGSTLPFAKGQDYKELRDYANASHIGLILDNVILVDYDANKQNAGNIISTTRLAEKAGLVTMPTPFQVNDIGNSIHWLLRLPDGICLDHIKASNDGQWERHVDLKSGNQVVHLKQHKQLPQGIPNRSNLPAATQEIINALRRSAKAELIRQQPVEETSELIAQVVTVLAAIPADIPREVWRNLIWSIASLDLTVGQKLLQSWSDTSTQQYDDDPSEKLCQIYTSFDPEHPRALSYSYAKNIARTCGWVDPDTLINTADNNVTAIPFEGRGGDIENGQLFAGKYRNKLAHLSHGGWLKFDPDTGWVHASNEDPTAAAKLLVVELREVVVAQIRTGDDANAKRLHSHVVRSQFTGAIKSMIEMAKSEPGMTINASKFDADPMLLGVTNGVIDLRTGELLPTTPDLLVSKRCNVSHNPLVDCPRFKAALVMWQPDPEMRVFLQRYFGLCLSGLLEQKLGFLYGLGANGKSVLIDLLVWLLGDYSLVIDSSMLMKQRFKDGKSPRPDLVALKGVRFAVGSELSDGQAFDEGEVKKLTGSDRITGRAPYAVEAVTFMPTHKLCLAGNHRPIITDTTHSMWRRPMLIGFDQVIHPDQQDKMLPSRLKQEGSGILNWLLSGLRDYSRDGLQIPKSVEAAMASYQTESDTLGIFIEDSYTLDSNSKIDKASCYRLYQDWAFSNGHCRLSSSALTKRLAERGHVLDGSRRKIIGLARIEPSLFRQKVTH